MGAQRCSISSNFVVSEIKKTNRIAFLDFLLLSRDGSSEVKCQLIDWEQDISVQETVFFITPVNVFEHEKKKPPCGPTHPTYKATQ